MLKYTVMPSNVVISFVALPLCNEHTTQYVNTTSSFFVGVLSLTNV